MEMDIKSNIVGSGVIAVKSDTSKDYCIAPAKYLEADNTAEDESVPGYDGWIDSIQVYGKRYAIKAAIVEYHALICPKCGGQVQMHNGWGKCGYCDTEYSAVIKLVESK